MSSSLRSAIDSASTHSGEPGATGLQIVRERRDLLYAGMTSMLDGVQAERRDMQASESRDFNKAVGLVREFDERIAELESQGKRAASAAQALIGFDAAPAGVGGSTHPQRDVPPWSQLAVVLQGPDSCPLR